MRLLLINPDNAKEPQDASGPHTEVCSDSSLEEDPLSPHFFESLMDQSYNADSSSTSSPTTSIVEVKVQEEVILITGAPELRSRNADPQNGVDVCSQADQSASLAIAQASREASQSIQQASQQATQAVRQATQSASQAAQQASQSASQAIQQAQQSAGQSISAASRSAASAMSSAQSAISSLQSSASIAISRANQSMSSAQSDASNAILQAGAAVAAATGSAAAAGSSFLAAAAKATLSADASISAVGALASAQVSQAGQQVQASQVAAVTATQAAVAIVGSIIASALITILIFYLLARHRKKTKSKKNRRPQSPSPDYSTDRKFPVSDQDGTTIAGPQTSNTESKSAPPSASRNSFSLFPKPAVGDDPRSPTNRIQTTSVAWNPSKPPRAPTLGSWLKAQDGVSPFGPISLPSDSKLKAPLGGQLKSPLRSIDRSPSLVSPKTIPLRSPKLPVMSPKGNPNLSVETTATPKVPAFHKTVRDENANSKSQPDRASIYGRSYRESKASVWTDDIPEETPPQFERNISSVVQDYKMQIPSPTKPVRTTAEWLAEVQSIAGKKNPLSLRTSRPTFGLPGTPRVGLPSGPGTNREIKSVPANKGPIAFIPGPKLAALTRFYEAYYDLILGGQYTFKLIELHKAYGPIIRISPWEVHIDDPDFYEEIYATSASGKKRDKYSWFTKSFGLDNSVFATVDHDLHRKRRAALAPFFSMQSVRRLYPLIQERVDVLVMRLRGFRDTGEVLMASWAFAALTNDVVMTYSFARNDNRLEAPDFDPSFRDASFFGSTAGNFMKHAPWLNSVFLGLPDSVVRLLHPALATRQNVFAQVNKLTSRVDEGYKDVNHPTIFNAILDSKLSPEEKTPTRLSHDAQVLVMAGTLTTAWTFEIITFWLLRTPSILRKLKEELRTAIPDTKSEVNLGVLEKLPYLNAIMKEGLRLSYGVSCRLARISPTENIIYIEKSSDGKPIKEFIIPPKTPVGLTGVLIHHNETIFPQSKRFWPERWLDAEGQLNRGLDKYMVSFTTGSRVCLGKDLAHAELYLGLGAIWRRWGSRVLDAEGFEGTDVGVRMQDDEGVFELYETSLRDVEIESDSFLPIPQPGSKGIRVRAFS
ncbi:hypothetical protein B7494_g4085 [Chlorociboria aeruginascens]|nr:hypothetical protein B7494_g4085 [Chlorociboria aeruginascens]